MGYFADIFRNRARLQPQAVAEFDATRHSTDVRARLRAVARYLWAIDDDSGDCKVIDESLRDARAAGPGVPGRTVRHRAAAAVGSGNSSPCKELLSIDELEALARELGDPARMYYVLESRAYALVKTSRANELIETRARQADYAIADFQRAYSLWARAQSEIVSDTEKRHAEELLQQALKLTDSREFEALHLHVLALLHRAARQGQPERRRPPVHAARPAQHLFWRAGCE